MNTLIAVLALAQWTTGGWSAARDAKPAPKAEPVALALATLAGHPTGPSTCPCGCKGDCGGAGACGVAGCTCLVKPTDTVLRHGDPPVTIRVVTAAPASPVKQWWTLTNYPGLQGYGALDSTGHVVAEFWRHSAAPAPTPTYQPFYGYATGGTDCSTGTCRTRR